MAAEGRGGSDLSCDGDLVLVLVPNWTLIFIFVIEGDRDGSLGYSCIALFVDKLLEATGWYLYIATGLKSLV